MGLGFLWGLGSRVFKASTRLAFGMSSRTDAMS